MIKDVIVHAISMMIHLSELNGGFQRVSGKK